MRKTVGLLAILICTARFTLGQSLQTVAAEMRPGAWVEVKNTMGLAVGVGDIFDTQDGKNYSILEYADKAVWDSVGKQFLFLGGDHHAMIKRLVRYREETNTWTTLPLPPTLTPESSGIHAYEHNAVDATGRAFYHLIRGTSQIYKLDLKDESTWTRLPENNLISYYQCCMAIEWFPEMKGLVQIAAGENTAGAGVFLWRPSTQQWIRLGKDLFMGNRSNFASYN